MRLCKINEELRMKNEECCASSDKKMLLSEHFTLGELTKTSTRIENVPNETQVNNLKRLCRWLERLRQRWNEKYGDGDDPLIINSAFRSKAVNKAVGGAKNSNHLTGCAADIRCIGVEQAIRYAAILLDISDESHEPFDELLIERNSRGVYWIHFAVASPPTPLQGARGVNSSGEGRRRVRVIIEN